MPERTVPSVGWPTASALFSRNMNTASRHGGAELLLGTHNGSSAMFQPDIAPLQRIEAFRQPFYGRYHDKKPFKAVGPQ